MCKNRNGIGARAFVLGALVVSATWAVGARAVESEGSPYLNGPPAHGREHAHRLTLQAPQHVPQHFGGARIDPLHVVEGDKKRPVLSKRAHDREERERDESHLRRPPFRLPHQ